MVGIATVYRICAALALAGAALFVWGLLTPVYLDKAAAYLLIVSDCDNSGVLAPHWHERMAALRTVRWPLINTGCSVMLLAATVAALAQWNVATIGRLFVTPTRVRHFFGLGLVGLGLAWFGEVMSIGLTMDRHLVPICADSPGIPLIGLSVLFFVLCLVCLVVGLLLIRRFAALPVLLFSWDQSRPVRSLWVSINFIGPVAILLLIIADTMPSESFLALPGYVILLYLAEAARSASVCVEGSNLLLTNRAVDRTF